jgi:hypothetical protein
MRIGFFYDFNSEKLLYLKIGINIPPQRYGEGMKIAVILQQKNKYLFI